MRNFQFVLTIFEPQKAEFTTDIEISWDQLLSHDIYHFELSAYKSLLLDQDRKFILIIISGIIVQPSLKLEGIWYETSNFSTMWDLRFWS